MVFRIDTAHRNDCTNVQSHLTFSNIPQERNKDGVMPISGTTVRANTIEGLKEKLQNRLQQVRQLSKSIKSTDPRTPSDWLVAKGSQQRPQEAPSAQEPSSGTTYCGGRA